MEIYYEGQEFPTILVNLHPGPSQEDGSSGRRRDEHLTEEHAPPLLSPLGTTKSPGAL
jgi:hypothetical protein